MERPELPDMSPIVTATMKMRESALVILDINDKMAKMDMDAEARMTQANGLRTVVEGQQQMLEHVLEQYMMLADMTDAFVTKLSDKLKEKGI